LPNIEPQPFLFGIELCAAVPTYFAGAGKLQQKTLADKIYEKLFHISMNFW
jgi:hypothetical protein